MQHTFKRFLSTLLVLVMVLTMVPVLGHTTASATTENNATESTNTTEPDYLVNLDFEGENPELGTIVNTANGTAKAVGLNGGSALLLEKTSDHETGNFRWYYPVSSTGLSNITVSYNIAMVDGNQLWFPSPSQTTYPYDAPFGVYGGIMKQGASWSELKVGEATVPYEKLRWHTVKIVYSKTNDKVTVYLNDQETNAGLGSNYSNIKNIAAQIYKNTVGSMYIDNVRATEGDHLPAVPTVPLCTDGCTVGEDGRCEDCRAAIYTHTVESVSAVLGDNLDMNFYIDPLHGMSMGDGHIAKIVQTFANNETKEVEIPQSQWKYHERYKQYYVTYGVAAKEMGDNLTLTILDSQGNVVSHSYTDTFKGYVERLKGNTDNSYLTTLCDDLLIYGAAAQKGFGYNTENLVSESRPSTPAVTNISSGDRTYWNGTSLKLESSILLKVFYLADAIQEGYSYQVTYTDHYGNKKTLTGTDFVQDEGDTDWYVPVTGLSMADFRTKVTVTILDANSQVLGTHTVEDSMESFVARSGLKYDIYRAIIQVGSSADNYFRGISQTT